MSTYRKKAELEPERLVPPRPNLDHQCPLCGADVEHGRAALIYSQFSRLVASGNDLARSVEQTAKHHRYAGWVAVAIAAFFVGLAAGVGLMAPERERFNYQHDWP